MSEQDAVRATPKPGGSASGPVLGIEWQIGGFGAVIGGASGGVAGLVLHAPPPTLVLPVAIGVGVGALIGFWLARPLKRDLRQLGTYAALLARGQFHAELPDEGTGELKFLMRQLKAMADSLVSQVEALRRLADERVSLAERAERLSVVEERQRLARELHDTVSQELFGIAMMVGAARRALPATETELERQLNLVEDSARRAQATMRGLIRALRPVELGSQSLPDALRALMDDIHARQGLTVNLTVAEGGELAPSVEDALFRIAQEAVSNAVRHGECSQLSVTLTAEDGSAALLVQDDGRGFDPDTTTSHIGFRTMRERAVEAGGRLTIHSAPGAGTTVAVRIVDAAQLDRGPSGSLAGGDD